MPDLKQSTSAVITVHLVADDGTNATGLTIANGDITLSKEGAVEVARSDTTAVAEDANGRYRITLNTTDTGTVGELEVVVDNAGIVARSKSYDVLPANVFDSKRGTDLLDTNVAQLNGNAAAAALQQLVVTSGLVSFDTASGTLSTTQATTDLTETTDDHYKNRHIVWLDAPFAGQEAYITAYDGTTKVLTFSPQTEALTAGITGVIV